MVLYPNPAGGSMEVANQADAISKGWTPSMGTFGIQSGLDPGQSYAGQVTGSGGGGGATPTVSSGSSQQLASGINSLLGAIASGNKDAFNEAVRQFNQTFGLDQSKFQESIRQFNQNFDIAQSGVTGTYQGGQTQQAALQEANIAAQRAQTAQNWAAQYGLVPYMDAAGNPVASPGMATIGGGPATLAAQQQAYAQQMGAINAAAALQANPFRQAQVLGQAGRVLQGLPSAGFSAPTTVAGVGTAGGNTQGGMGYLSQLIADIKDPTANQTTAQSWLDATPTPNKLDSVSFLRSSPTTQNLILQAQQEKYGIDPADSLKQIQATMPQFNAPNTIGTVRRG